MIKLGLLATLEAKTGKENDVLNLLIAAEEMAKAEDQTVTWYAFQTGPSTFGIFDTFNDDDGRAAHLNGPIAAALMQHAEDLLSSPPDIKQIEIIATKG